MGNLQVAAIDLWFRLCLPSCGPRFESQALHLRFFQLVIVLWFEKDENKQKRGRDWPIFFKKKLRIEFDTVLGASQNEKERDDC